MKAASHHMQVCLRLVCFFMVLPTRPADLMVRLPWTNRVKRRAKRDIA
jgi:hypothetical protein